MGLVAFVVLMSAEVGLGAVFGRRTPAADYLLATSKGEDAHEYYRSDTRPNGPCN
jgi:hypothetical protein